MSRKPECRYFSAILPSQGYLGAVGGAVGAVGGWFSRTEEVVDEEAQKEERTCSLQELFRRYPECSADVAKRFLTVSTRHLSPLD
jgi:hypothetical protein